MNVDKKGWNLIRSSEEWEDYCRNYELAKNWPPGCVNWQSKPASYPCLVGTHSPHLYKVINAYVYVSQATHLLAAAGMNVSRNPAFTNDKDRRDHAGDTGAMSETGVIIGGEAKPNPRPVRSQANFNRYVQANMLALWRSLSELTGEAFTAERAHDAVIGALSDVDRWAKADADQRVKMDGNQLLEQLDTGESPV
jgi:hypothetical protein